MGFCTNIFSGMRELHKLAAGTGFILNGVRAAFPRVRLVGSEIFPVRGLAFAARRSPFVELHKWMPDVPHLLTSLM